MGRIAAIVVLVLAASGCANILPHDSCAPVNGQVPEGCPEPGELTTGTHDHSAQIDPSPDDVHIYMSDLARSRIGRMDDLAGRGLTFFGTAGSGEKQFGNNMHIRPDSTGRILLADRDNNRIVRMDDLTGRGWISFGSESATGQEAGRFNWPMMAQEGPDGRIYFTGGWLYRVDGMDGSNWTPFTPPSGETLQNPKGITFDPAGRLYIVDTDNHRIVRVDDFQGNGWTTFGVFGHGDGQFDRPESVGLDAQGRIYITDNENDRIVRVDDMTGSGWVDFAKRAGSPVVLLAGAPGDINHLEAPHDLAIGPTGRIYVADTGNHQIIRMDDMQGTGWIAYGFHFEGTFDFEAPKGLFVR